VKLVATSGGAIYLVPAKVDLAGLSNRELVALQLHNNDWYVRTARRLLQERVAATRDADDERTAIIRETVEPLRGILESHDDSSRRLRTMWTLHAMGYLTLGDCLKQLGSQHEYVRAWAIQLMTERCLQSAERLSGPVHERFVELAKDDSSPVVRLYLASAMQRIPMAQRLDLAEALLAHADDAQDHNLPLMYWYAIEPLVPDDPPRAMKLAAASKIALLTRHITRRAAADNRTLDVVIAALTKTGDVAAQLLVLDEMLRAFEGRVNIPMPDSWAPAYDELIKSEDSAVRDRADKVAVALGDRRIFPRMRGVLTDDKANLDARKQALDILVRGRDKEAAAALQSVLDERDLRIAAIRALIAYDDANTPAVILAQYGSLDDSGRSDAVSTLTSRPAYALALLDAVQRKEVPNTDLHAYHIRQLLSFQNEQLNSRIKQVWGEIRETSQDKQTQIAAYKTSLSPDHLKAADVSNGRRLFVKSCASCHTLFGEGGKVGPDITGSNRANLDYILENIVDPSAVLGKDYRMTVLATVDGRVISGLVQKETDSALTIRTINDTLVVAKQDIEQQQLSNLSLMPERLLETMQPDEVRDLVAYLASPAQVTLRGPRSPIDSRTKKVPGALEGESLKVLSKSAGDARSQKMSQYPKDAWSGTDHLWWTGTRPGARLELEVPVAKDADYEVEIVLTKARDYGIVQLSLDGQPLGGPIDLFNNPDVITTGVLTFNARRLTAGNHTLSVEIVGANPGAVKSYMFGLDYIRLVPPQ
jgi:putative heme-binding domain-containing protein